MLSILREYRCVDKYSLGNVVSFVSFAINKFKVQTTDLISVNLGQICSVWSE